MTTQKTLAVLFLNRSFYPEKASTGQLLTELCEDLASSGDMSVTVIAGQPTGEDVSRNQEPWSAVRHENYKGIEILRTGSSHFSKTSLAGRLFNYLSYFLLSVLAVLRTKRKPDVIVSYTDPPIIGLVAWFFSRVYGSKFVFVCQDIFPQVVSVLEGFRSRILNAILERVSRFLLSHAQVVIVIGEVMKQKMVIEKGVDERKIQVIHNWADSSIIYPAPRKNEFAEEYGLTNKFVVMHSGNIGLTQSLEVMIEAAKQLAAYSDIQFVIVGEGVKKESLMELTKSYGLGNVQFIPYQPKEKLSNSFSSADLFLISLKDGLAGYIVPSKLYGILAAGKPFIASIEKDSEVYAILERYQCGLWASPQDATELAEQIVRCRNDPSMMERLSVNALAASRNFERQVQVERYRTLLFELSNHPDSRVLRSNSDKEILPRDSSQSMSAGCE